MARATTVRNPQGGDPPKHIEDAVRALPANQGKNNYEMWQAIDAEITQARSDSTLKEVEKYNDTGNNNKHGNK